MFCFVKDFIWNGDGGLHTKSITGRTVLIQPKYGVGSGLLLWLTYQGFSGEAER